MENNEMQDAKRIEEQTAERKENAQARAATADDHAEITAQRKATAHVEMSKFQLLGEMFGIGQKLLEQRNQQYAEAEQAPPQTVLLGLQAAHAELGKLVQQTREHAVRHEGALQALQAMEEAFQQSADRAGGQERGAEMAGQRALDLAARSGEIDPDEAESEEEAPDEGEPEDSEESGGLLDVLGATEDSAKEPIAAPKKKAAGKGSSRRKA
jgi:hypothetical protein